MTERWPGPDGGRLLRKTLDDWVIDGDKNRSVQRPKKKKLGAARAEHRKLLSRTKTTVGGKEGGGNALHMLAFV